MHLQTYSIDRNITFFHVLNHVINAIKFSFVCYYSIIVVKQQSIWVSFSGIYESKIDIVSQSRVPRISRFEPPASILMSNSFVDDIPSMNVSLLLNAMHDMSDVVFEK
jgi:hypothetical protein